MKGKIGTRTEKRRETVSRESGLGENGRTDRERGG